MIGTVYGERVSPVGLEDRVETLWRPGAVFVADDPSLHVAVS